MDEENNLTKIWLEFVEKLSALYIFTRNLIYKNYNV